MKKFFYQLIMGLIGTLLIIGTSVAVELEINPQPVILEQDIWAVDSILTSDRQEASLEEILPITASMAVTSQPTSIVWGRAYGGTSIDKSDSFVATQSGDYIIAGETKSFGVTFSTIYVTKTNSTGIIIWSRIYGLNIDSYVDSVQETPDNGFIVSGTYDGNQNGSYLLKLDQSGNAEWIRTLLGEFSSVKVKPLLNGYVVGCGYDYDSDGEKELFIFATDALGNPVWTTVLDDLQGSSGNSNYVYADVIPDDSNGSVAVFGQCLYNAVIPQGYLTAHEVSSSGNILLSKTYASEGCELQLGDGEYLGTDVIRTNDGGYALIKNNMLLHSHDLTKLDNSLDHSWTKTFNCTIDNSFSPHSIAQTMGNGYIITGSVAPYPYNVWLLKLLPDGSRDWEVASNVIGKDIPSFVHQTADGGFVVGGTGYNNGDGQIFLVKYQ